MDRGDALSWIGRRGGWPGTLKKAREGGAGIWGGVGGYSRAAVQVRCSRDRHGSCEWGSLVPTRGRVPCRIFLILGVESGVPFLDDASSGTLSSAPPPKSKLLPSMRANLRLRHYSPRTEEAYVSWVTRYVRFHHLRHPGDLGEAEVRAFLTYLAVERRVAPSTLSQALAAILFLYREVLRRPLTEVGAIPRPRQPVRLPVVLTVTEVRAVLTQMRGTSRLVALVLYGSGLRIDGMPDAPGQGCRPRASGDPAAAWQGRQGPGHRASGSGDSGAPCAPGAGARLASRRSRGGSRAGRTAGCARSQVSGGGSELALAVGLSGAFIAIATGSVASGGGIICTNRRCSGPSRRRRGRAGSASARLVIPSGIRLPRTSSKAVPTSGRYRSCWGIGMSARR